MDFKEIIYTREAGIGTITLNRPQALNAFTPTMIAEWLEAIESAKADDEVRVLVVTGSGRGFCTGLDLSVIASTEDSSDVERLAPLFQELQRLPRALAGFEKLYIASINGLAIGAGTDACAMADLRIASDRAKFSINHTRVGSLSLDGGYYYLTRLLGVGKTLELAVTHEIFDAAEAQRIGLVNMVVPHDDLARATGELAGKLARGAPIATRYAKRLIYEAPNVSLDEHLTAAYACMTKKVAPSEDFREGFKAISEKRVPEFKGR